MRLPTMSVPAIAALLLAATAAPSFALEECRLMRQPDVQGTTVVFVYGGDLWTVSNQGGVASRITSHEGLEQFPKLSPDGQAVAFTGEYDGNVDAFTVPVTGGEPKRLTWHPGADRVAEWYPDGRNILLRSQRMNPTRGQDRFFKIAAAGGFETPLQMPLAGYASFSGDGKQLAFMLPIYDNRTWKHYRGGNAPDIWTYDFANNTSRRITDWVGPDEWPMWYQNTIYYVSDRGGRVANLWAYDFDTQQHRQVTSFEQYDVKWPSIGGNQIVFENGGYLYVMELPGGVSRQIHVMVPDDKPGTRPEWRNVAEWTENFDLSPSAKRAVIEARGEIFTVPAEKGDVRNLTRTPASRERDPAWSPDGKWIAYWSDQTGEYELWVAGADGKTPPRQVTRAGAGYRFAASWSPDSKKLAFGDKTLSLFWCDVASGKITKVAHSAYGDLTDFAWSGDSQWLAYSSPQDNTFNKIFLAPLGGTPTAVSDGMTHDFNPAFDPDGKTLYFVSRRRVDQATFTFEYQFLPTASDKIYAATLRADLASPFAPQSDEESGEDKSEGDKGGDKADKKDTKKPARATASAMKVDLAGLMDRVAEVPGIPFGRYGGLNAFKDKLLYMAFDEPDPEDDGPPGGTLHVYDLEKRESKTVIEGIQNYAPDKDGGKILYRDDDTFGIVGTDEQKKSGDGKIEAGTLMALVDPPKEWMQMFNEAWRLQRDFYYDPGMGGLDWKAIGDRYRQLVPYVAHRSDLNYILGEMQGEVATSHAYVGGGDMPDVPKTGVGLLGADYELDPSSNRYTFKTLYTERDWNGDIAAPLGEPGIRVKPGDVLLSVNGVDVRGTQNVYAAFEGTVGKQTTITVGNSANDARPRTYTVEPVANEFSLRYRSWVAANRAKVAKATGGRVAYIHVPNTATAGIEEFTRQFYPQVDKDAIIVDERWNGGGFIPDFFVERLRRKTYSYWSTREGAGFRTPPYAIDGPKCMLINQYAGSGGDAFPYYFRLEGLGPVIGKRTWGGLVGISRSIPLVDGGTITFPDFGFWDPRTGKWEVENHGVDPDIEVENRPEALASGQDPQLERAIQYVEEQLKANPPKKPEHPAYKVQEGLKK